MQEDRTVRLTVIGIQDGQRTVTETSARLRRPEGGLPELRWTVSGGTREEIRHTAVLSPGRLRILQRGAVHCEMDLREGETTDCDYETAMGTIPMAFRTARVSMRETPRSLLIRAAYTILPGEIDNVVTLRAEIEA
ncbi:MAG: DUF1934 domain-containing protein [Lachnospiraceae bacterium]|nr:DUF1934 domain-containing protein [Lachnospiraceae bacterium]